MYFCALNIDSQYSIIIILIWKIESRVATNPHPIHQLRDAAFYSSFSLVCKSCKAHFSTACVGKKPNSVFLFV